ncbi:ATPase family [Vibrio alginolyticus]|nr:ATPase family [Vibrio alginolyticus]
MQTINFFQQSGHRLMPIFFSESQIIVLVKQLLVALLADGHILVEGPPGLAKTRAVKSLSDCVEGDFHRIQFTPDLLPADLTGTDIFPSRNRRIHFPIRSYLQLAYSCG